MDLGREVTPATPGVGAFDKNDGGTTGDDTTSTVGTTISTAEANEWAISVLNGIISGSTQSFTPDPGWTGGLGNALQQIVSGAINMQGTWGLHCWWAECMALLKLIGTAVLPTTVQAPLTGTAGAPISAGPFVSPITAGNVLICTLEGSQHDNNTGTFGVSDTINGDWGPPIASSANVNEGGSTNGPLVQIFAKFNSLPGSPTFTVTGPVASGAGYFFGEYAAGHAAVTNSGPVRCEIFINGRAFVICGADFDEIFANGTFVTRGQVANDSLIATAAATPQQILIASAGTAYVFDLMANTLTPIAGATFPGPVSQAAVCDGFFLLTIQNTKEFFVSAPLDATDWVTNGSAIVSVFADNIVSMLVHDREIHFWSDRERTVYYDSGNIFPFDVIPGTTIQAGSAAKSSPARLDDRVLWLNSDDNGSATVKMGIGYTPQRISTHALEFAMQGYARVDDAVGYTYQDQGHSFYVLYFPTPSKTWVYDATISQMIGVQCWHEREFYLASTGGSQAHKSQCHMFAFGKHLVGDWSSGKVYQMQIPTLTGATWTFADDDGNTIRRVRRAPHISKEQKRLFVNELRVYLETGLGPIPPLAGVSPYPTIVTLADSDGVLWDMTIADDGTPSVALSTSGQAAQTIVLNVDGFTNTSLQITVDTSGNVGATEVPFVAGLPTVYNMASIPSFLNTGFFPFPPE